jgi:hypothetical protein
MKTRCLCCSIIAAAAFVAPAARGQESTSDATNALPRAVLEPPPPEKLNWIGLSYRMGLNITVDFKKLGGFQPVSDPGPPTGSTYNRSYDNGSYNRVDISTNAGGLTWYWGYQSASQVQGNSLVMQSSSSPANGVSSGNQNDPQHGLELSYRHQFYRAEHYRLGLEAAFGWTTVDVSDRSTVKTTVNRITDSFTIPGGVFVLPAAPYNGTFEGPGALIGAAPDRATTVVSQDAIVTGVRQLNSQVYTLRLGPYVEVPLVERLSFLLSGGLTVAAADTKFSYQETVTIADAGLVSQPRSSSGSQTDWLVGGYVGGALSCAITKDVSVFAGAQYQAAGQSVTDTRKVNGQSVTQKESILHLGKSVMVVFGFTYSF